MQALLQLVHACLHATHGRLSHLEIRPGTHATSTSSTRLSQTFRLDPDAALQLLSMHAWKSLSLPLNPTITATPPPSLPQHHLTEHHPNSTTSPPATYHPPAAAGAVAPAHLPASRVPSARIPLIQLLPRSLHTLTLRLTGRLADTSPLSHLGPTLRSLTLTGFSGCSVAHAGSLAALSELRTLSLAWVQQHGAVGGASHSQQPQQGFGAPGAVAAAQLPQQVWGTAGVNVSSAHALPPGGVATARAEVEAVQTFWGVLASGLPKLHTLRVRGSNAAIDVRGLAMHMQAHASLSDLSLHLDRATDLGPGVLVCLTAISLLTSLSLTYLSFQRESEDLTLSGSEVTLQPLHAGGPVTAQLGSMLGGGVGEQCQRQVRSLLRLDSDVWQRDMQARRALIQQQGEQASAPPSCQVPSMLLQNLQKLECCHCRSDTVHTLLLLRAASQAVAHTPQVSHSSTQIGTPAAMQGGASTGPAPSPTSHMMTPATLELPVAGTQRTRQSQLYQGTVRSRARDTWATLHVPLTTSAATGATSTPAEAKWYSPSSDRCSLAAGSDAAPPAARASTWHNATSKTPDPDPTSLPSPAPDPATTLHAARPPHPNPAGSETPHMPGLRHLRISYPSTFGPCAASWLRSLGYGPLSHTLAHLDLEGVLCLSDELLRQVLDVGVGPHLTSLGIRSSAVMVREALIG